MFDITYGYVHFLVDIFADVADSFIKTGVLTKLSTRKCKFQPSFLSDLVNEHCHKLSMRVDFTYTLHLRFRLRIQ